MRMMLGKKFCVDSEPTQRARGWINIVSETNEIRTCKQIRKRHVFQRCVTTVSYVAAQNLKLIIIDHTFVLKTVENADDVNDKCRVK
jgi:hypothetical protein